MEFPLRTSLIGLAISVAFLTSSVQAQTPSFTAAGVVNAASGAASSLAPGMLAQISGSNLGDLLFPRNCGLTFPVTTNCGGTSVLVNGTAAPVVFSSGTQ